MFVGQDKKFWSVVRMKIIGTYYFSQVVLEGAKASEESWLGIYKYN